MWPVKVVILLLLYCYGCLAAAGGSPYFVARNFNNVLHWESDQHGLPAEEVLYSVRYWSDVDDHAPWWKAECQNITSLSCDLTAETPSIYDVHYTAEVYADGRFHGRTYRFKPIAETVLGPPILSISTTVSSLNVNVTLPMGPNRMSILDIFNRTKRHSFNPPAVYILTITHPTWAAQVNESTTGQFVIHLKNNNTEYRGYVVYKPTLELGRPPSEITPFREMLPGDPWKLYPWYIFAAAILIVPIIISAVFICRYVRGGKEERMPGSLVNPFNKQPEVMLSLDKNLHISKPEVCPPADQKDYSGYTVQVTPKVPSGQSAGYSPQDTACVAQPWDSSSSMGSPPGRRDTSGQSTIYSAVTHQVPSEEAEGWHPATNGDSGDVNLPWFSQPRNPKWDIGGTGPMGHGMPPKADLHSQESSPTGCLFLPTLRDSSGQIKFSMLTFQPQMQSSIEGIVSPFTREGQLHLSDLVDSGERPPLLSLLSMGDSEWSSDSGCDQSSLNTPTQLSFDSVSQPLLSAQPTDCQTTQTEHVTFESGYNLNWMPASWNYKGQLST